MRLQLIARCLLHWLSHSCEDLRKIQCDRCTGSHWCFGIELVRRVIDAMSKQGFEYLLVPQDTSFETVKQTSVLKWKQLPVRQVERFTQRDHSTLFFSNLGCSWSLVC